MTKMCLFFDIPDEKDYQTIKDIILEDADHWLSDVKARAILLENPIVFSDDYSNRINIKDF